jgi:hypothetical protein
VVVGHGLDARLEFGDVGQEMIAAVLGLIDHRSEAAHLLAQRIDLALHPGEGIVDDRASFGRV